MSRIENVLRTEAWNGGRQDEYMRAQYAQEFSEFYEEYAAGGYLRYGDTLPREYTFLKTIVYEYDEAAGYDAFLDSIAQKAQQLSSISIFANSADGYDLANIEATARAFEGMRGIPIQYYPQRGLMTALDFALTDVVAVFAMLLLATVLVRFERDTGLLALIRSAWAGRCKTALAKLAALALSLAPVLVLLYGVNLIYCHACYGLGPLSRSVQSVPALMRTTLSLSVGQYIGLFLLTKWAAALAAGAWVMLAMLAAKRLFTGALAAGGFLALNLLVRSLVPATSRWNVLKYANLVSLLRTNEFLGRYHNLYWFGRPLALAVVTAITAVVCCTTFCALFCLVFTRGRLQGAQKLALRAPAPLRRFWARHARAGTTPFGTELFKLFCVGGAALILCLFGAYQVYDAVQTESYIDADEIYYRYYMQNMQGPLRAETLGWLKSESEKFQPLVQLQSALAAGSISQAEYSALMMGYDSLQREMGTYQRVLAEAQRAAQLTRCQLVYGTGWLRLFDTADARDAADALAAALLCCVCFAGLFAMEKQTGMARVMCAALLGGPAGLRPCLPVCAAVQPARLCRHAGASAYSAYSFDAGRALCGAAPHGWVRAGAGPAHRQHVWRHVRGGAAAVPAASAVRVRVYRRKVAQRVPAVPHSRYVPNTRRRCGRLLLPRRRAGRHPAAERIPLYPLWPGTVTWFAPFQCFLPARFLRAFFCYPPLAIFIFSFCSFSLDFL